jgi:hypothetical protein
MLRFAAPFVGLAALVASPAYAQSAAPPADPNRALSDLESGSNWMNWANTNFSVGMDCSRVVSVQQGLQREANAYQRLGNGFGKIGYALTTFTAMTQAAQGKYQDAGQTVGEALFDKIVCASITVAACAGWSAGRAIGATIKMMPWPGDSEGRTIEDVVTDKEVEWLLPYLDQPMNVKNMEAAFSAFQRKQADIRAAQERARQFAGQCSENHHGDEPDYADRDNGSSRQSTQGTSADRAMELFRGNGGDPNQSWNNAANYSSGQSSAPTYSPAPVQQSQPSSSSGFDFGQAVGAVLTGYAIGTASKSNQSSSSSKPSSAPAPAPSGQGCGDPDPDSPAPLGYCN